MSNEPKTKKEGDFSVVNLKRLSEASGITYARIYAVLVQNRYSSMDENEKTALGNTLFSETQKAFNRLGFTITLDRL